MPSRPRRTPEIYSTLGKLERGGLIAATSEADRRKNYLITERGTAALVAEAQRIATLHDHSKELL